MYFSKRLSLLFIACPKTGSTSIEKLLMDIDPRGETHGITTKNRKIASKNMYYGVVGHARAWEFKQALGDIEYNKLYTFGMVRHPFDKLISSYYFAKSGSILKVLKWKGEKNMFLRKVKGIISHTAPKILPLNIWVLLFPMKTSYDYYHDKNGKRIVQYLGRTDHLDEDLKLILNTIGIAENIDVPHINKSKHRSRDHYFKNKWIRNYLAKKYQKDLELYQVAEQEMEALQKHKL